MTEEALARLGIDRPTVHVGQIATGDEFIHGDLKEVVRSRTPDAICVDMEGAAVAQVCLEHGGVPLCVIRAISDLASGTASVDFPLFLDSLARHYSAEILTRMFAAPASVGPVGGQRTHSTRLAAGQESSNALPTSDVDHSDRTDQLRRVRGLHPDRWPLAAPADVHVVRSRRMLQRLPQPSRSGALRPAPVIR